MSSHTAAEQDAPQGQPESGPHEGEQDYTEAILALLPDMTLAEGITLGLALATWS